MIFKNPLASRGVTESERYLEKLCNRTFLSMWSYPGIYRDQWRSTAKSVGKEICDLLVIFESNVIIFSDKYCEFPYTDNLALDWCRWFRRAVWKSSQQLLGAKRWISDHPKRLFLDRNCTSPFPIRFPATDELKFHLIVVAHGSSKRCSEVLGGSGSFMIAPLITGKDHFNYPSPH